MQNPLLLSEVDKYRLTPEDFSSPFEKYVFAAINNLYIKGVKKITVMDIDNYLIAHEGAYQIFQSNNGIEYLTDAEELAISENFNYYYTRLKKFNAIRDLQLTGFNTEKIYPESLVDDKREEKLEKFEKMSVNDIFTQLRLNFSKVEDNYSNDSGKVTVKASHNILGLIEELKNSPEVGINLQGDIFNTAVRGGRKGKFYIRSAGTGVGKTRSMLGDACYIAYPIRYNTKIDKWEYCGGCEKVLYIGTEQTYDELQTIILAYLSGVNEEKILFGTFNEEEEIRLKQAAWIMEKYEDNLIIDQLPNPNIAQIKSTIRSHFLMDEIENVFYDYIFSSAALLAEHSGLGVREDVILGYLSTALKDIAVELNVFLMSATQVNRKAEEQTGIKNQNVLRGATSIGDKVDLGAIISLVTEEELRVLGPLINEVGIAPNQVTDIYKLRRGRYNNVRIWSYADLGTCRKKDLFITNAAFKQIDGFQPIHIMFNDNVGEYDEALSYLNHGEVTEEIANELESKQNNELEPTKFDSLIKKESSLFGNLL